MNVRFFCFAGLIVLSSLGMADDTNSEHDPTRPAFSAAVPGRGEKKAIIGYELQSIILRNDKRFALINDQFVSEGQTIGENTKVLTIHRNEVIIVTSGKKTTLYLFDNWK